MRQVYLCEECGWEGANPPFDSGWFSCPQCGAMVVISRPEGGKEDARETST
jgi:predicted RNA-binding Zn-ribbon protein involved in translation (DUF1610 family)